VAYFLGRSGRQGSDVDEAAILPPDPGYSASEAEVIETGYDGRERYRLNARLIRQQTDSGEIQLESLEMRYHAGAAPAGERAARPPAADEVWHLTSDRGVVRADGDDVQLAGNVRVTGPTPGGGSPLTLSTTSLSVNTPTEYIETDAPVTIVWSGHALTAQGLEADLKQGNLRLKSDIHGKFSQ
jgi:lipopolysaccharide export system protein LptC